MTWNLACPDWEQRLRSGRSLVPDLPLDLVAGNRAVAVFNKLRLPDVVGTPTLAEAAGDWFRDIVRALFGSYDAAMQQRFIREIFCLVPKKNSKTSYGAELMLTALLLNERPRAPFILTAPVQDTAELAFSQIAGAIALDPVLDKKLHVREHLKTIVHRETKAELEVMSFDPAVVTGKKPIGVLIDEMHVIAKMSKAASALRQLRGGMLPFPEAFLMTITTQSEEAPVGIFESELEKARAVRDGKLRAPILPVLYEFPLELQAAEGRPWRDPSTWHMVTPNAGRSITVQRLIEEADIAERTSAEEFRAWASQHLNIQIGVALRSDSWAGAEFWDAQGRPGLTLQHLFDRCEVITVGIDGGGLDDMLGLAVLGRETGSDRWLLWCKAWLHPIALERRKSEASRYADFKADGDLDIIDALPEDVSAVANLVLEIKATGLLASVGMDPERTHKVMKTALEKVGIEEELMFGIPQSWKLTGAMGVAERKLAEGTMTHGGTRLMAYSVGNAKVEPRGNAQLITKQASGWAKIDPLMASLNAVSLMALNPEPMTVEASARWL